MIKKSGILVVFFMVIILLVSCTEDNNQQCDNCFDPKSYDISAEISISNLKHSHAEGSISVVDKNQKLESIKISVIDSNGMLHYIIPFDEDNMGSSIKKTFELNYLIQNETYTIVLNGFLNDGTNVIMGELASSKITTSIWQIEQPKAYLHNSENDSNSITFSVFLYLNDLRGKRIAFEIYENNTLVDEIPAQWFLNDELYSVSRNHTFYNLTFENLKPDTQYTIFSNILYLSYDYDAKYFNYESPSNYLMTFKTNPEN
jgi:hypothetical protein